jgi:hypothetical protein
LLRSFLAYSVSGGLVAIDFSERMSQVASTANLRYSVRVSAAMRQILWYGLLLRAGSAFFRRCVSNGSSIETSHANRFLSFLNKACKRFFPVQSGGYIQLREHLDEEKRGFGSASTILKCLVSHTMEFKLLFFYRLLVTPCQGKMCRLH